MNDDTPLLHYLIYIFFSNHVSVQGLLSLETCDRADALADAARCAERHVAAGVHNA